MAISTAVAKLSRGYLHHVPGPFRGWQRSNINVVERGASAVLGALAVRSALRGRGLIGRTLALAAGAGLLARAVAGKCAVYRKIGVSSA